MLISLSVIMVCETVIKRMPTLQIAEFYFLGCSNIIVVCYFMTRPTYGRCTSNWIVGHSCLWMWWR